MPVCFVNVCLFVVAFYCLFSHLLLIWANKDVYKTLQSVNLSGHRHRSGWVGGQVLTSHSTYCRWVCADTPSSRSSAVTVMTMVPMSVFSGTRAVYTRSLKNGALSFMSVTRIWISATPNTRQTKLCCNESINHLTFCVVSADETRTC